MKFHYRRLGTETSEADLSRRAELAVEIDPWGNADHDEKRDREGRKPAQHLSGNFGACGAVSGTGNKLIF